jgi:hypothetical protein
MQSRADTSVLLPVPQLGTAVGVDVDVTPWRRHAYFGDFQRGALHLSAELRNEARRHEYTPQVRPDELTESRAWFAAAAYRLSKRFEIGSYVTDYVTSIARDRSLPTNHISDVAATVRVDLNRFWQVKVEGHWMDGYGTLSNSFSRSFYRRDNATPSERTNMIVVRTGINF